MLLALAGTPDQWYGVPARVHQAGGNYFLPGTEDLRPVLAQP